MATVLREVERPARIELYVARRTQIGEYPFWCQMFVRFVYLPAQIVCPRRPLRLGRYAFKKWGYSEIQTQSICTSEPIARGFIGSKVGWFFDEAPVDVCEPEETALFRKQVFPNSEVPEHRQRPDIKMVAQSIDVCDQISDVTDKIHELI